jgi:hypothetical protein
MFEHDAGARIAAKAAGRGIQGASGTKWPEFDGVFEVNAQEGSPFWSSPKGRIH